MTIGALEAGYPYGEVSLFIPQEKTSYSLG